MGNFDPRQEKGSKRRERMNIETKNKYKQKERKIMKNKKLFAAAMTAALAVSMMGTSVMAADVEGDTKFQYTPGTAGPIDPVKPGQEETDTNNWMVVYPRTVTLTDSNLRNTSGTPFDNGASLSFTVKQKQAGADNDDTIKKANIPNGIDVKAETATTNWAAENITMNAVNNGTGTATMQLAGFGSTTALTAGQALGKLTDTEATKNGKAELTDATKIVDGNSYATTITFSFAPSTGA